MSVFFVSLFKEFFSQATFLRCNLQKFLVVKRNFQQFRQFFADFATSASQLPSDIDDNFLFHSL